MSSYGDLASDMPLQLL